MKLFPISIIAVTPFQIYWTRYNGFGLKILHLDFVQPICKERSLLAIYASRDFFYLNIFYREFELYLNKNLKTESYDEQWED